jgi:hypothetical protein
VHALRLLGCEAYGEDISEYAISNCHEDVKKYLSAPNEKKYDLLICKDVLEHVPEEQIEETLSFFLKKAKYYFFVIPLADNNKFRINEYESDITHVTRKDEEWWLNTFKRNGFNLKSFSYNFGRIKEKWIEYNPYGNGFFVLEKSNEN